MLTNLQIALTTFDAQKNKEVVTKRFNDVKVSTTAAEIQPVIDALVEVVDFGTISDIIFVETHSTK